MALQINNRSDQETWDRYIAGSNDALADLVAKYNSRLIAFLTSRKCRDPESTCQEVWKKVIDKRNSFDGKSFSGWVFAIARNLFTEQIRRAARRDERELGPETDVASDDEVFGLAKLEKQEMFQTIRDCMNSVGEPFANALQMKMAGTSTKVIADTLGAAENTVYTRIHRAKKMIRDCVEAKLP